jgi:glycosyltransferase involved in cell wall biosynthesis
MYISVIYNGYDEEDFSSTLPSVNRDYFLIRYVGNLMASENPEHFWKAVAQLIKQGKKMKLELIGRVDAPVQESIRENGLESIVEYKTFVPHKEATQLMQTCDMLLFLIPNVPDNKLILTGKLFEYLGSGTPLISFGPVDGDAAAILLQTGRARMIGFDETEEAYTQLNAALQQHASNALRNTFPVSSHSVYSRRSQTAFLAEYLELL